jgi:2-polyprenyl-6-methoxyphenol hydroxylase-like FAD-dependent oxidoreductase
MRVLIIGAGLGGLTLAHGLRRAGIDVEVFERSSSAGAQPASYGLHLDAEGLRALHGCLPAENWERFTAAAGPARDFVRFQDPQLRPLAMLDRETTAITGDPVTRRRGIRRDALRDALLHGLDGSQDTTGVVHWDKTFTRYEPLPDDSVRVWFADGTHTDGDLLVGADGSNSRVRHQRLPDLERLDLGIVNIAGSLPLAPELASLLPATLTDGSVNNVVPAGPGWMFLATWRTPDTPTPAPTTGTQIVWAWAALRSSYPNGVEQLPGHELRQLVADRIRGWASVLQRVVADTDPATIAAVPLRSMPPLPNWSSTTVTLLGDAIHNMTPMGGVGANTALRDAEALRAALITEAARPHLISGAVADYEQRMRTYANDALALSTRNAHSAASEARLPRFIFRTLLRLAEAFPPVKRAVFRPASS